MPGIVFLLSDNFLKILKGLAIFFYHKSPNHVQIPDLGHFLEKIITLLNLYLVLLLEQSIVHHPYQLMRQWVSIYFLFALLSDISVFLQISFITHAMHTDFNWIQNTLIWLQKVLEIYMKLLEEQFELILEQCAQNIIIILKKNWNVI